MLGFRNVVVQAARPALIASVLAVAGALLGGCTGAGYDSPYNKPNGKALLVSKENWADFKKYLGKIGSTRDGAFAMGVYNGKSDGWASSACSYDSCYGGNAATEAMKMCREGGECVLFAIDDNILVNYKVDGEDTPAQ